ncbi:MAG: HAMP domain-containing sensor histidine kinase, partial [Thermodesulfobacteriota bacterium]|nr:HAMP domain-containing sensor histidine kinase [Thermodesulfobacteriota bacterium]
KIKQGLMHMIIHDLNNPLTAISGSLEILLMDIERTSERQYKRIEKCYAYCKDLNLLIQSLLDIHKMEEATLVLEKEETSMHVLLDEVLPQFTQKTASKNISLSFQISKDLPSVPIDQKLIKRVIANLLNNAIRHTPEGGHIKGTIHLLPEKRGVFLSIKDNGNGLEPENHRRIFDKFEQVKLKQAGVSLGSSGLGLAFCKMAVEAHEGKIWVESEGKDKGSTFCFVMPT